MSKVMPCLGTIESIIFSLPGSPSLLPAQSRPKDLGAPEALSKATLMGSWHGASSNFIMPSKVGSEGCQAKPQRTREEGKQGPACQGFCAGHGEHSWHRGPRGRAGPAFKSPLRTNAWTAAHSGQCPHQVSRRSKTSDQRTSEDGGETGRRWDHWGTECPRQGSLLSVPSTCTQL